MANLILDSLEIQGFRAFRHLKIERLGRVNLITGKNNVGKTCLLEALKIYARRGDPSAIWSILQTRNESQSLDGGRNLSDAVRPAYLGEQISNCKFLFYGRPDIWTKKPFLRIGPVNSVSNSLSIAIEGVPESVQLLQPNNGNAITTTALLPSLVVDMGGIDGTETTYPLWNVLFNPFMEAKEPLFSSIFVPVGGVDKQEVGRLWDQVIVSNQGSRVVEALNIISHEHSIESIYLLGTQDPPIGRSPKVKITNIPDVMPLGSLGEGMNRLFGLALALASAKDGMLLVDEVESGLHYSVQPDMWRLIFEAAQRLNVQVFATTHSYDCIAAFQQAAAEDNNEEAKLIRLENKNGDVTATVFDERQLTIATREEIEVR